MKRICIIISLLICGFVQTSVVYASAQPDDFDLKLKGIALFEKGPITHDTRFIVNWLQCSIIQDVRKEKKPRLDASAYNNAVTKTRVCHTLRSEIHTARKLGTAVNEDQQNAASQAIKEAFEAVLAFKRSNDALIAQNGGRYCQNLYCWQINPCRNDSCKK